VARIRFVHFAAPPISRLIARRGHVGAHGGCCGAAARERRLEARGGAERGGSAAGRPAGKRIAAREPPKLDYSCRAALNGVTHVRDGAAASRGRTTEHVPLASVPIGRADERRDAPASRASSNLIETPLRSRLIIDDYKVS